MSLKLGVIGGGNMGRAIVTGAIRASLFSPSQIIVVEIDQVRREAIRQLGCIVSDDPRAATAAQHLLLAVKPQSFAVVAKVVAPLPRETLVISIMAGLDTKAIRAALGEKSRVVRVMPNTPSQVGQGMSAVAPGAGVRDGDEQFALELLGSLGRTIVVDESIMHAVTAVSGSGPAYVFLLCEAMERAAQELGLDSTQARLLARQTILGAGALLMQSSEDAGALRRAVTSPGGTTEAALRVMLEHKFPQIVVDAITAARDRGRELSKNSP